MEEYASKIRHSN